MYSLSTPPHLLLRWVTLLMFLRNSSPMQFPVFFCLVDVPITKVLRGSKKSMLIMVFLLPIFFLFDIYPGPNWVAVTSVFYSHTTKFIQFIAACLNIYFMDLFSPQLPCTLCLSTLCLYSFWLLKSFHFLTVVYKVSSTDAGLRDPRPDLGFALDTYC